MGKLLISFLSSLLFLAYGCAQSTPSKLPLDCTSLHVQDSLIKRYIDNGAVRLPNGYNNPAWQLYCDSILAICPGTAAAYQLKAVPFIKSGEYEKAFVLNDRAVQLAPQRYTAYRGFLKCIFTKDYEGAIIDFKKAQQLTPNGFEMDHSYPFFEGLCNLELGNYARAEQNFKHDIFIQTGGDQRKAPHFNTLLYVGILYYEMGQNARAREYLLRSLKAYRQLPEANYYLAMVYEREGNAGLKKQYLEIAQKAYKDGYRMNEDNLLYANYPHQIKLYEIEEALSTQ